MISYKKRKNMHFQNINNEKFSAYLRIDVKDKSGVLSNITKTMAKNKVSIKRLIQNPYKSKIFFHSHYNPSCKRAIFK